MPTLATQPLTPDGFRPYGYVVQMPTTTPTAADNTFSFWSDVASYHMKGDTEIGLCTVYRQEAAHVTWMERHIATPEVLIPIDAPFVLPVVRDDAPDSEVEAFEVKLGEAVIIGQGVWHSACIPAGADTATYFVIFRRGTPQEDVEKKDVTDVVVALPS